VVLLWRYRGALALLWCCGGAAVALWRCFSAAVVLLWRCCGALALLWCPLLPPITHPQGDAALALLLRSGPHHRTTGGEVDGGLQTHIIHHSSLFPSFAGLIVRWCLLARLRLPLFPAYKALARGFGARCQRRTASPPTPNPTEFQKQKTPCIPNPHSVSATLPDLEPCGRYLSLWPRSWRLQKNSGRVSGSVASRERVIENTHLIFQTWRTFDGDPRRCRWPGTASGTSSARCNKYFPR
jgi:hypothetical protein